MEFSLILTILFLLVFGIIQFGMAYNRYQGLQAASREGARTASLGASQSEIRDRVRQSQSLFGATDVKVKIDYSTNDGTSYTGAPICDDSTGSSQCSGTGAPNPCGIAGIGNLIRITATVPSSLTQYAIVIPLWGSAPITYTAQGVFRCEKSN